MKKRIFGLFLAVVAITMCSVAAYATDSYSGACGDNLLWEVDRTAGTLTISGEGEMRDYEIYSSSWFHSQPYITRIEIGSGVTRLGGLAFAYSSEVETIVFQGDAPSNGGLAFLSVKATAYYPAGNDTWTESVRNSFGGALTWIAYEGSVPEDLSGTCGDSLSWELANGILTISGSGAMNDYATDDAENLPWDGYASSIGKVVIGNNVTSIGNNAFKNCVALSDIRIPASVTSIGDNAFQNCTSLNQIVFEGSAPETIAETAFTGVTANAYYSAEDETWTESVLQGCGGDVTWISDCISGTHGDTITWELDISSGVLTVSGEGEILSNAPWAEYKKNITSVVIEDGITAIGSAAFNSYHWLEEITIPNSVTRIGASAFCFDYALTEVTLPNSLETIGQLAFSYCTALTEINLPESLQTIGHNAFSFCYGLTDVSIPASVTAIPNGLFWECINLTSVTLPETLDSIGNYVFYRCYLLEGLEIPASVASIGNDAFLFCYSAENYTVEEENANYCSVDGVLYSEDMTVLVQYPAAAEATSYEIPASVTAIDYSAFHFARNLTSIEIPVGVTSIGEYAFSGCTGVTAYAVEQGSTAFCSVDGVLYTEDMTKLVQYPAASAGTSFEIPGSVKSIAAAAFYGSAALTEVTVPASVTDIGDYAFSTCELLEEITFKGAAPCFGQAYTFFDVTATAYYPSYRSGWDEIVMQDYDGNITWEAVGDNVVAYGECGDNLTWTLDESGVLTVSGTGAMTGFYYGEAPWFSYRNSITGVTIDDGVTSISSFAFHSCSALTEITIPTSVTSIGQNAFTFCTSLTRVEILGAVSAIPVGTFYGCTALSEIALPDTVTTIGNGAFYNCSSLTSIDLPDSLTTLGDWVFQLCSKLSGEITIPASVTSIGQGPFLYCSGVENYIVEEGNTAYCSVNGVVYTKDMTELVVYPAGSEVTSFEIPETVTTLRYGAFHYSKNLTSMHIPVGVVSIGNYAFSGCKSVPAFTVDSANSAYCAADGVLYNKDKTTLINYPCAADKTEFMIPDSVTTIGGCAFFWAEALQNITVPASVTTVEAYAFATCSVLPKVHFEGDAPSFASNSFLSMTATAYYPADNDTWTDEVKKFYGGTITWVAAEEEGEEIEITVNTPTSSATNATVTAPEGGWKTGKNTFTVACEKPCRVFVSYDGGKTYIRLTAVDASGGRCFTAENMTAETQLEVIAAGDINGDGKISVSDISRLRAASLGKTTLAGPYTMNADVNDDGKISVSDISRLRAASLGKVALSW